MDSTVMKEPRKGLFFSGIIGFYLTILVILIILEEAAKFSASTIATLLGAIAGPSAPTFIAIYLSRYSEQAEVSRKQILLMDISIRKEISEATKEHYRSLQTSIREFKSSFADSVSYLLTGEPENPLTITSNIDKEKLNNLSKDEKLVRHLETNEPNGKGFSIKQFSELYNTIETYKLDFNKFDNHLSSIIIKFLDDKGFTDFNDTVKPPKSGTSVGLDAVKIALTRLWTKWYSQAERGSLIDFNENNFPKRPSPVNFQSINFGMWYIGTPNLKFENQYVLTYTDSPSSNYEVCDLIKEMFSDNSLQKKFKGLNLRRMEIMETISMAKDLSGELDTAISKGEYQKRFDCCPYYDIDIPQI